MNTDDIITVILNMSRADRYLFNIIHACNFFASTCIICCINLGPVFQLCGHAIIMVSEFLKCILSVNHTDINSMILILVTKDCNLLSPGVANLLYQGAIF